MGAFFFKIRYHWMALEGRVSHPHSLLHNDSKPCLVVTELDSSRSQLSRAMLNPFRAPILAENRFAGEADHRLSLCCSIEEQQLLA